MNARQLPASDYNALKAALRELLRKIGTVSHAARLTRISQQHMSRYASPDEEWASYFAPIDVIADLEAEVGPVVTRELARLTNHILVELPPGGTNVAELGRISGKAMKEVGDVFTSMGQMLDDGTVEQRESRKLGREIDEAIVMLVTLKKLSERAALHEEP